MVVVVVRVFRCSFPSWKSENGTGFGGGEMARVECGRGLFLLALGFGYDESHVKR